MLFKLVLQRGNQFHVLPLFWRLPSPVLDIEKEMRWLECTPKFNKTFEILPSVNNAREIKSTKFLPMFI